MLGYRSSGMNQTTEVTFKSSDGSEFKLNSLDISRGFGDSNFTIKGYRDNSEIVSSSVNISTYITFDVSGDSNWENIDEVKMLGSDLDIDIDDLDFSDAVVPTYSVTYNENTGTGGSVPTDGSSYTNGQSVTVLGNTGSLVKMGYTFAGWNTLANGSGADYVGSSTFSMGSINVTLYAKWTEEAYTVTYNGNGNTNKGHFQIMVPPVNFEVYCSSGNKTVKVSKFNAYVERRIAIQDDIDPSKITTAVVLEEDGTLRHVPTKVIIENGRYYALINSMTNSQYTLIYNDVVFEDIEDHWGKEIINNMGSRMIVSGVNGQNYEPQRTVTRAKFSSIVVRSLGLAVSTNQNNFTDIFQEKWYTGYITTLADYSFVSGDSDGGFRPDENITREEAMVVIDSVIEKVNATKESEISRKQAEYILSDYVDTEMISDWAVHSIANCVQKSIVKGSNQELRPEDFVTRAEMAVLIKRMLEILDLI